MLDRLKCLIEGSTDCSVEHLLENSGIEYKLYYESEWTAENKFDYRTVEYIIDGKYYRFEESRQGSYYTDYYYDIDNVEEFVPDTRYRASYIFPNEEIATRFMLFVEANSVELDKYLPDVAMYTSGTDLEIVEEK
ncbi:hypothetical protein [Pseudoalteromonas phage PH357]|nr:hypothetical protein [Pseudoalteromonas phage PH357]